MKYRTIGTDPQTRREVSVLSLGTMHFGTATDEVTSLAILDRYAEAGGTFIDTADNYAWSRPPPRAGARAVIVTGGPWRTGWRLAYYPWQRLGGSGSWSRESAPIRFW
jgi:Aldo/keto reductase family